MLHTLRAATVNGGGSEVVIWVQTSGKVSKKAKGGEKKATHNRNNAGLRRARIEGCGGGLHREFRAQWPVGVRPFVGLGRKEANFGVCQGNGALGSLYAVDSRDSTESTQERTTA